MTDDDGLVWSIVCRSLVMRTVAICMTGTSSSSLLPLVPLTTLVDVDVDVFVSDDSIPDPFSPSLFVSVRTFLSQQAKAAAASASASVNSGGGGEATMDYADTFLDDQHVRDR